MLKTGGSLKECPGHCSSDKAEVNLERKQHLSWIKGETDVLPCHLHISVCLYFRISESWTLIAELEKRTQAFEMRFYRRLLNSSYKDHVTNEEDRRKIHAAVGEYYELLAMVNKRKLRWFGHVSRSSGLAKTILQGTMNGKRRGGRQKKRWEDNIKEWTLMDFASSTRAVKDGKRWKGVVAKSSVVSQGSRLWDRLD